MMAVRVVQADRLFSVLCGIAACSHKETIRPKHVMCFDNDTSILCVLRHIGTFEADSLGRARLSANHVVLGPTAKGGESFGLVGELIAQRLGALVGGKDLP